MGSDSALRGLPLAPTRFSLVRHGQTTYNALHRLNGDPLIAVHLDATGRSQCAELAVQLRDVPFGLAVHTGFPRTIESLDIILAGRNVPRRAMPEFGDVRLGDFEGRPVREYRQWRRTRTPADRPPGGESRLDALARYAAGTEQLLAIDAEGVLAVMHDVPIRFIANAANGDDPLDGPITAIANTELRSFDADELTRALAVMRHRLELASSPI